MRQLILIPLLLLCSFTARPDIVYSVPFMTASNTPAVFALRAGGEWTIMEMSGATIQGMQISPISATGAGPGSYDWAWKDPVSNETWGVKQDCKGMTVANCLKAFLKKVNALKRALGFP